MNNFYILEINVNNQLRHAYSAKTKKDLVKQILKLVHKILIKI